MTNEEILQRVIAKAVKNGVKTEYPLLYRDRSNGDGLDDLLVDDEYYRIIFQHDFAKAFWGDKEQCHKIHKRAVMIHYCSASGCDGSGLNSDTGWQHHLQMMVLEEEPLLYLKKFL